jgi:hypothetical protein
MKAAVIHGNDGSGVLRYEDVQDPYLETRKAFGRVTLTPLTRLDQRPTHTSVRTRRAEGTGAPTALRDETGGDAVDDDGQAEPKARGRRDARRAGDGAAQMIRR